MSTVNKSQTKQIQRISNADARKKHSSGNILWWGRSDHNYSRNRIVRKLLKGMGWNLIDFSPASRGLADIQSLFQRWPKIDLVWVPCFRHRDLASSRRWCNSKRVPLIFDPLISSYDKQVFERKKVSAESLRGRRLLRFESKLMQSADLVLADTVAHARYFEQTFEVPSERLCVVPVGAEETLFSPCQSSTDIGPDPLELLFYGSFIDLQGPQVIVEAARLYKGVDVVWTFIGDGPLSEHCTRIASGLDNVVFEPWVPYEKLPERVRRADILLGIFGVTPKARRVIPNKVYQALACGKPVVTMHSKAYPQQLVQSDNSGIIWVEPGDASGLAEAVANLALRRQSLALEGRQARHTYEQFFSQQTVQLALEDALKKVLA